MADFKYKIAYKCKSKEEASEIHRELARLGYDSSVAMYNEWDIGHTYISTGWNNNHNGLGYGSEKWSRELIDSKELFIALASMRDSDKLHAGEYVYYHWEREEPKILQVINTDDYDSIATNEFENHFNGYRFPQEDSIHTIRKATKEELEAYFTKEVKESKVKVGIKFTTEGMSTTYTITKVEGSEVYLSWEGTEDYQGYTVKQAEDYFNDGTWTIIKETIKEEKVNKKFKNQLAIKGDRVLLEALAIKFVELGLTPNINSGKYDWIDWNKDSSVYLKTYKDGEYAYHNHYSSYSEVLLELPQDWNKALELAAEVEEKLVLEVGNWYRIETPDYTHCDAIVNFQGIDNNTFGINHAGNWTDYYGCDTFWKGDLKRVKPATEEEIKEVLIKEAKKRYPVGTNVKSLYSTYKGRVENYNHGTTSSNEIWINGKDNDEWIGLKVYCDGKWAEILPSYSVGDWVLLSRDGNNGLGQDSVVQLMEVDESKKPTGELKENADFMFKNPKDICSEYLRTKASAIKRLATKEEIKKASHPDITINGYKAIFKEDQVRFGCAEFHKDIFIQFDKMNKVMIDSKTGKTNRNITSITLGSGEFTMKQIKEIAEYYKNK